ncbi:hypothetical protein SRABI27_03657 [Pedobacter sp. Bi27]|uniref:hypothetical protein n=1 Tax=Pedobacter sp. Bi27 TaxID=2822351 RepID=UPI001D477063|nr:hypothetical protein [Pedobacter sp. Bi27]CAH0276830.1 hypothetical protein SRABI27_03657 [Pedobacter sp. Bi27]
MINPLVKTVGCSIAGTTMMTASSALMSLIGQDFRESERLNGLISRVLPFLPKRVRSVSAWAAHYAMGSAFSAVYVKLWDSKTLKPTGTCGVCLGAVSGLIGIAIWKATFAVHPLSPLMNYKRFYLQRIPAHIVFAIFATIAYRAMQKSIDSTNGAEQEEALGR